MASTTFGSYVNDFLDGSYTVYNYEEEHSSPILIAPQIAGFQKVGPSYFNETKNNPVLMINLTTEGKGQIKLGEEEVILEPGDLVVCSNYYYHCLKALKNEKWEFYFVHIYLNEIVNAFLKDITSKKAVIFHGFPVKKMTASVSTVCKLMKKKTESAQAATSNVLFGMLTDIALFAERESASRTNDPTSALLNLLNLHYSSPLPLKDLSKTLHYSKNHLERLFKARTGQTIQEYLYYLRLTKAEEYLIQTEMPYNQVALSVGLSEYRSLYHMIKKTYGVSPSEFRAHPNRYKNTGKDLTHSSDSEDPFVGFLSED
ncbi:MAG: AraC family transcriptional regulator [Candidatus Enteromonas sp.]|nr:AraC family transcriptional regulator [Candidatus Enteromonas sp.]